MFERVLIANRGEIAVRIIRTLRRLGIGSVAVYSDADRHALHVRLADVAIGLGPGGTYLDVARIVAAARHSRAQALHPGYGFLSENPALARACAAEGIAFIGPPPEAIELMGDKIRAKQAVAAFGVPVVPGRDEAGLDDDALVAAAKEVGLPVLLKPSAGGGGKGMRRVDAEGDLAGAIAAARREAVGAFGDGTLLVERYVTDPRHIEMQVFADRHGTAVALGERECSLQRRHQKIVEEAPSPWLDADTRAAMAASAAAAARACAYVGAGTVEFIVSATRPGEYFFMEMNTRLQVEHPVTEMVLGLDLVELQLRVAAGEALPWVDQSAVPGPDGHAIEARIYAEDPDRGFLPATGRVRALVEPAGPGIRVDSSLEPGIDVGTAYDPMLAKVIAHGPDRPAAIDRLVSALRDTTILGVTTNTGFLGRLLDVPAVRAGHLDTGLVERIAGDLAAEPAPEDVLIAAALVERHAGAVAPEGGDPWLAADGWRVGGPVPRTTTWGVHGSHVEVALSGDRVRAGSGAEMIAHGEVGPNSLTLELVSGAGGPVARRRYRFAREADEVWIGRDGDSWHLILERPRIESGPGHGAAAGRVTSPMPGTVLAVHVAAGDEVSAGQRLVTVEAMKMEHVVTAATGGTVTDVLVREGDTVKLEQALVAIGEATADGEV